MLASIVLLLSLLSQSCATSQAGSLDGMRLTDDLQHLAASFDGRVGICVRHRDESACVRGGESFPMQSVMKLVVAVAVLDAVDRAAWRLEDEVILRPADLSLGVQPIAKLITPAGYRTTVRDLMDRMVTASDSAATDVLIARLGGPTAVQSVLDQRGLAGIRLDRDERHLQTELLGLTWRADYVDADRLRADIAAVPDARRQEAFDASLNDPRDTATPTAMAALLADLAERRLLSPSARALLITIMDRTATFPDRLKAGLPPDWTIGHKTGTGLDWRGVFPATNDVGLLHAPDGDSLAAAVFISGSRRSMADQSSLIAAVARLATASYRRTP